MRVAKSVKGHIIDVRSKRLRIHSDEAHQLAQKWNLRWVSFDVGTGQGVERGMTCVHPQTGEITVVQFFPPSLSPVPVLRVSYGYADRVLTLVEG